MCLQITRLKDILTAKPFDPSSAFQAFVMRPCPSSGFEPLKELPHKRLTGEGARGCSGPRSALASLQQPLAGRETVGSPSSPLPPPSMGLAWGAAAQGRGAQRAKAPRDIPAVPPAGQGLLAPGDWGDMAGTSMGRRAGARDGARGYPGLGRGMWDQPWGGSPREGAARVPAVEHCRAVPVAEHSRMHSANHRAGPHGVARHGSALKGTCLGTTWLSAEHCGTQLAWLGTAGRDLALHNSTRRCMAQLTSAQCGLLWHGTAQLGMVLNCGHSSARHGLAQHGSA